MFASGYPAAPPARRPTRLAMLLREHMDGLNDGPQVQVFATDIDEPAIGTCAAPGAIPATLLDGVSPERRERFFIRHENSYVVSKEVRDLCIFSAAQPRPRSAVLPHRPGVLPQPADLYGRRLQVRSSRPSTTRCCPAACCCLAAPRPLLGMTGCSRHWKRNIASSCGGTGQAPDQCSAPAFDERVRAARPAKGGGRGPADWAHSLAVANSRVLERFAAPFVIVTDDGSVVHYSSHVGDMLQPALGPPSRSVFDMARRGLRHGLRSALRTAVETGRAAEQTVQLEADGGGLEPFTLVVEPLPGQEPDRPYLIVFKGNSGKAGKPKPALLGRAWRRSLTASCAKPESSCNPSRRARDCAGGAEKLQRGAALRQRGTAIQQRGAGDLKGGDTVGQRGAADRQRPALSQGG